MPRVELSKIFTSDYGHTVHVDGDGFLPNNQVWVHTFYPTGKSIGGQFLRTDPEGKFHTTIGEWSSSNQEIGKYIVYVYYGEFRSGRIDPDAIVQTDNEVIVKFDLPYRHESSLKINEFTDVPWGVPAVITGVFESKDDKPDGPAVYNHKEIHFTGTYVPSPVYTNEYGRFQAVLEIPKLVQSSCTIQAHFNHDGHFGATKSRELRYNVIKHECFLSLSIDDLNLRNQPDANVSNNENATVKVGRSYRLEIQLKDKILKTSLGFKKIIFKADDHLNISAVTVDANGIFELKGLLAPNYPGKYTIKASFEGDQNYMPADSNEVELNILSEAASQSANISTGLQQLEIKNKIIKSVAKTCKRIDLQAMVIKKSNEQYHYVILKMRLTKQNSREVEKIHFERKVNAPKEDNFVVRYDIRDITELESILEEILDGEIRLDNIKVVPIGSGYNSILDESNKPIEDIQFTSLSEREGYPHRILVSQMERNAVAYVDEENIYYQRYAKSFDNLGFYLGIKKLNTQNNIIIVLPYYCKFIELSHEENRSYIAKIRIHDTLISNSTISFEMTKNDEPYLDSIYLINGVILESNETSMKDILIPRPNLEGVTSLEVRILHEHIREITSRPISTDMISSSPLIKTSSNNLIFDNLGEVNRLLDLSLEKLSEEDESDSFEKKASMRYDYQTKCTNKDLEYEIAKAITGLMNGGGGLLVVGVNASRVVGLNLDYVTIHNGDWDKWLQRLGTVLHSDFEIDSINDNYYNVSKLGEGASPVALIKVGKAPSAVWMYEKDKNGKRKSSFYVRRNNQTVRLQDKDLYVYIQHHFSKSYSVEPY